ncbi:MAG TPA: SRPBCC family protein [Candidatus Limnocylindrales bacterium]|nr:SRPBCC family protein [Candidatus Limnocylindrales bacterium]
MEKIQKSIEVDRPIRSVYNQWTHFEEFPRFIEGVKQVKQLDDSVGLVSRRIENDLDHFKDFIEKRGQETGAWRGTIR